MESGKLEELNKAADQANAYVSSQTDTALAVAAVLDVLVLQKMIDELSTPVGSYLAALLMADFLENSLKGVLTPDNWEKVLATRAKLAEIAAPIIAGR